MYINTFETTQNRKIHQRLFYLFLKLIQKKIQKSDNVYNYIAYILDDWWIFGV